MTRYARFKTPFKAHSETFEEYEIVDFDAEETLPAGDYEIEDFDANERGTTLVLLLPQFPYQKVVVFDADFEEVLRMIREQDVGATG